MLILEWSFRRVRYSVETFPRSVLEKKYLCKIEKKEKKKLATLVYYYHKDFGALHLHNF
jgi:hypothetical protein